jgi:hypothetical protein
MWEMYQHMLIRKFERRERRGNVREDFKIIPNWMLDIKD